MGTKGACFDPHVERLVAFSDSTVVGGVFCVFEELLSLAYELFFLRRGNRQRCGKKLRVRMSFGSREMSFAEFPSAFPPLDITQQKSSILASDVPDNMSSHSLVPSRTPL